MIEAFKATLEEIYLADLVLLVLDAAEPLEDIVRKFRTSREVLAEYPVKVVTVMNKIDLLPPEKLGQRLELMKQLSPHVVPISALKRVNLPSLLELVRKNIFGRELA
jgi:GTP-binding protein HflX